MKGKIQRLEDRYLPRKPVRVSDETVRDASFKLTEPQFIAWKYATLMGLNDVQISERMNDINPAKPIFPSSVRSLLEGAVRRGFPVQHVPLTRVVRGRSKAVA